MVGPDAHDDHRLCGRLADQRSRRDRLALAMVSGSKPGTTSAVMIGNHAWAVIAKLDYLFSPALIDKDPGPFTIYSVLVQ